MKKIVLLLVFFIFIYNENLMSMNSKPYHHLPDGTFRNPEVRLKETPHLNGVIKYLTKKKRNLI